MHRIEVKKKTGPRDYTCSWEDVSNLEELKQALARYGPQQFWLEKYSVYDETIIEMGNPKAAETFTEEDFDQLIEREGDPTLPYDHCIAFKPY